MAGKAAGLFICALAVTLLAAASPSAAPVKWHSSTTAERFHFSGGLLPATMRWTNRPTFQQVISFSSHRRR